MGLDWAALVLLAILFAVLSHALPILLRRWIHIPRSFRAWKDEFSRRCHRVIDTDMEAAESKIDLAEMIGHIPDDFDPTIWLTCQVAQGYHREVLAEAERRGKVSAGTFQRVYGISIEEAATGALPLAAKPEPVAMEAGEHPKVLRLGDRLVPRGRRGG